MPSIKSSESSAYVPRSCPSEKVKNMIMNVEDKTVEIWKRLDEKVRQYDWYEVLKNFVSDYEYFFNILHSALTKHSPMSTLPKRQTNIYLTNEAMCLKNAKNRAWKRYLSTRTNYGRVSYIKLKNKLHNLTRNLRSSFEKKMANDVKLKPKLFWKYASSRLKSRQPDSVMG